MKRRELEAIIKLSGITDPSLQRALRNAKRDIDQLGKDGVSSMKAVGRELESLGKDLQKTGKTLTKAVTAPLVGIGAMALKTAIDTESAFAGMRMTIDGTAEELEEIKREMIELSQTIPVSAIELKGMAEAAGRLGIKNKDIGEFVRVLADLNATSNIGAEGADAMAKFANVTGMSAKDFRRLGSTIAELGNTGASTDKDILDMAMRLGGAGAQLKLTQAEILGLSAALSNVGIEAQAGGSAFSKIMVGMQLAVETGKNELEDFARVAGMSNKEFQQAFKQDAAGAIQSFVVGLSKMDEQGISTIKMLDDMGIKEVRLRDTLLRASNASGMFSETMRVANEAWRDNSTLAQDAGIRYETTASQLAILKNTGADIMMQFGETMMPYLKQGVSFLKDTSKWLKKLSPQSKDMAVKLAGIAAAAGPVMTIFGKFISGSGKLMQSGNGLLSLLGGIGGTLGVVGLAGTALWGVYSAWKAIDDAATSTRLAARFGDAKLSAEELQAALDTLNTPLKGKVDTFIGESERLEAAWGNVKATQDEIGALNFQIDAANVNVNLSEAEKRWLAGALAGKVHELSGQVVALIGDKYYQIKAAFDIVGAEFKAIGLSEIQEDIQTFYNETQQEAMRAAQELYETMNSESFKAMSAEEQNAIVNAKVAEFNEIMSRIAMGTAEQSKNVFDSMLWKAANAQYSREEAAHLRRQLEDASAETMAGIDKAEMVALAEVKNLYNQGRYTEEQRDEAWTKVSAGFDDQRAVLRAQTASVPALIEANQLRAAFRPELEALANKENWGMGGIWDEIVASGKYDLTDGYAVGSAITYATGKMEAQQKEARMLLDGNKEFIGMLDSLLAQNDAAGGSLFNPDTLKNLQEARSVFSELEEYIAFNAGLDVPLNEIIAHYESIGASLPEGTAIGVTENEHLAIEATEHMAQGMSGALFEGLESNSPSKLGIRAGQSLPQGVAIGITGLRGLVKTAMQELVGIVRDGLEQIATMRVSLPSISGASVGLSGKGVQKFALGGTVYGPTSAILGEAG
ncbi:MAG: phage tail tape measure protein, partial [Oscillospiraceae bacterium]|nr:phage tail tape measure protein [Oscillospiraceae bacterium]